MQLSHYYFVVLLRVAADNMSLSNEGLTPSVDQFQPQNITVCRHAQLTVEPGDLQQTGSRNHDDAIVKMASQVTADAIDSAVRQYKQSLDSADTGSGSKRNGELQYTCTPADSQEPAEVSCSLSAP